MRAVKVDPVTFEELSFALAVGSAAASGRTPQSGVGGMGVTIDMGDGNLQDIGLTDIPHNRAMIAIRDQFPREKFLPLMMRTWALSSLMDHEKMSSFTKAAENGDSEAVEVHEAILAVAAVMPLNNKGLFNANTFFRRAEAQRKEMGD